MIVVMIIVTAFLFRKYVIVRGQRSEKKITKFIVLASICVALSVFFKNNLTIGYLMLVVGAVLAILDIKERMKNQ